MKKLLRTGLALLLAVTLASGQVFSMGIFVSPGAKACGLGGAFAGVADDLTAIYYNPAGLTQLEGDNVAVSESYSLAEGRSNTSVFNSGAPVPKDNGFPAVNLYAYLAANGGGAALAGIEPSKYNDKQLDVLAPLPFAAGNFRVGKNVVAVGFYAIGGGGGRWEDTVASNIPGDSIHSYLHGTKAFMIGNVSVAREISKDFSLAAGLDYVYMMDQTKFAKEYNAGTGSTAKSYAMYADYDASGAGVEGVLGAMYKINDKSRLGLTFKTGTDISLMGKASGRTTGFNALTGSPDVDLHTNYTEQFIFPLTVLLGYSRKQSEKLLLSAEVEYVNYQKLKNIQTYDTTNPLFFVNSNESAGWKDQIRLHVGSQYDLNKTWCVRAGLSSDPGVYDMPERALLDTFMYDLYTLDLGVGFSKGSYIVDVDVTSYDTSLTGKTVRNGRDYTFYGNTYKVMGSYKFN